MGHKIFLILLTITLWFGSCKQRGRDRELPTPNDDPVYLTLTGHGNSSGRTWRPIAGSGNMGIGDKNSLWANRFRFPEEVTSNLSAWNQGVLQNAYTFIGADRSFIPKNHKTTVWGVFAESHFNIVQLTDDDIMVSDPNLKKANFELRNERNGIGTGYTLKITDGSYMGRFDNCYQYEILSISDDTLRLRHLYTNPKETDKTTYAWYSTYVSNSQQDLPISFDKVFSLLTHNNATRGKTWRPVSYGLGKSSKESLKPEFFDFNNGTYFKAWTEGVFKNRYTFIGIGQRFIPKNNSTTVLGSYCNTLLGVTANGSEYISAIDPNLRETKFKLVNENNGIGTGYTLEITESGYMGHFDNRRKYQIMSISNDTLQLRHLYSNEPNIDHSQDPHAWYSTYVANDGDEFLQLNTNPIHLLLTDNNNTQGKTWKHVSSNRIVGKSHASIWVPTEFLFWDPYVVAWTNGLFKNRFTFVGLTNTFIPKNQHATVQYSYANEYLGMNLRENELAAVLDQKLHPTTFILTNQNSFRGTGYTLQITDGSYMGIGDNRSTYHIMSITEDTLKLRHESNTFLYDTPSPDNIAWYHTYVRER